MKPVLAGALALALLALPPLAGAHAADAKKHFTLVVEELDAGASRSIHAVADEGALREGWVLLVVGGVVGNATPLEVTLSLRNSSIARWTWTTGDAHVNYVTTSLPETSFDYVLTLRNPGAETLKFFFYFDQSCNCLAKPVLPFPGALAMFNFDMYAGERAFFQFEPVADVRVAYDVAWRTGTGGSWPHDFDVFASYPEDALPNGTMSWTNDRDRMVYIMAITEPGPAFDATPGKAMLVPQLRVAQEKVAEKDVPAGWSVVLVAAAGVALALRRR